MDNELNSRVRRACVQLHDKTSLLAVCPHEKLGELRIEALRALLHKNPVGVYVSLNKPYGSIDQSLKKAGLDTSKLYYIDCVTSLVHPGKVDKRNHHVFHVSSPSIVAEEGFLPNEIERFIVGSPRARFIVIDTLRTLALYNTPGTISNFMRHVLQTAGKINSKVVVLTIRHEEDKVTEDTMPLFDMILNIDGE